jgi:hypothetical protein
VKRSLANCGMQAFSVDDARLSDAIAHYAPIVNIVNLG